MLLVDIISRSLGKGIFQGTIEQALIAGPRCIPSGLARAHFKSATLDQCNAPPSR